MTPQECRETYRSVLDEVGEDIYIRRYLGTGANRPRFEVKVRARVMEFTAVELSGSIIQGDVKLIVLAEDLISAQFDLPILKNDKAIVRGKEINIESSDGNTRRIQGEIIAYELQGRG